jgi:hypothetical protein
MIVSIGMTSIEGNMYLNNHYVTCLKDKVIENATLLFLTPFFHVTYYGKE